MIFERQIASIRGFWRDFMKFCSKLISFNLSSSSFCFCFSVAALYGRIFRPPLPPLLGTGRGWWAGVGPHMLVWTCGAVLYGLGRDPYRLFFHVRFSVPRGRATDRRMGMDMAEGRGGSPH